MISAADGISDVQSRIAAIQARIATLGGVRPPAAEADSASAPTASAADFSAQLAPLLAGTGGAADPTITGLTNTPTSTGLTSTGPTSTGVTSTWPTSAGPGGTAVTGDAVVATARAYIGVPYVWGGTDPAVGLDCSGLVRLVYKQLGIPLPRVSQDQAKVGTPVQSLAQARPGDLLVFRPDAGHVAIYAGNNRMIEAPRPGLKVREVEVTSAPVAIRRVLPSTAQAAGSTSAGGFGGLFSAATTRYGLPAGLLEAVARAESGLNPSARSHAGALGLMQLMPATASGLGVDPLDPAQAVDGAARLLKSDLGQFGSLPLALAAYNAGTGAVQRYGGIPPYAETQAYVQRVLGLLQQAAG